MHFLVSLFMKSALWHLELAPISDDEFPTNMADECSRWSTSTNAPSSGSRNSPSQMEWQKRALETENVNYPDGLHSR